MTMKSFIEKHYSPSTLEEFEQLCARHDWFYYFSDMYLSDIPDKTLRKLAEDHDDSWKRVYNTAHALRFNTPSFYPVDGGNGTYSYPFDIENNS